MKPYACIGGSLVVLQPFFPFYSWWRKRKKRLRTKLSSSGEHTVDVPQLSSKANGYVTQTLSFGGFIKGLETFTFAISGKLMGCLDLGELASASQDDFSPSPVFKCIHLAG